MNEPAQPQSSLLRRVITGLLLSVATLAMIWLGVIPFAIQVLVLAGFGLDEYFGMAEKKGLRPARSLGKIAGMVILVGAVFLSEAQLTRLLMVAIISICVVIVLRSRDYVSTFLAGSSTVLGVVYLGWMFSFIILLRRLDHGAALVTLLVVASAFTDMGGYFIGRWLGRIKLYPTVSPKKTVEGSLGAVVFALAACWWVGAWLSIAPIHRFGLGLLVAVVGQLGDLFESALKRDVGVKDSGTVIAGHGGALDRFDSLTFSSPLFYLYAVTFAL
ncbi:MAG: phosphatidate cytidylyltransferase [Vulcanimicrobiota bacterium]